MTLSNGIFKNVDIILQKSYYDAFMYLRYVKDLEQENKNKQYLSKE
jgi:hypothetical protein